MTMAGDDGGPGSKHAGNFDELIGYIARALRTSIYHRVEPR
jgi:hypothetical protein